MTGPLRGITVVELGGIGPAPFAGMMLADLGADVVVIERPHGPRFAEPRKDLHRRGKRSVALDLKAPEASELIRSLAGTSDIVIEGFRPGVAERLGVGPDDCMSVNPALVYGRMTGWGQHGPRSASAGHDIDYIAVSGALGSIGTKQKPIPPLNLVGDFGGGGMFLVVGVLAALTEARATETGQVVDAAMTDGSALLMTSHHGFAAEGWWGSGRESNLLDGGAPFYTTYETADGGHIAVGALEPQFFGALLDGLGLEPGDVGDQHDRQAWPHMRDLFASRFATRTRDEWAKHFAGTDACVAPVLNMFEAAVDEHNRSRGTFVTVDDVTQPAPAPRFSGSPASIGHGPVEVGAHTDEVLAGLGLSDDEIGKLRASGAIG